MERKMKIEYKKKLCKVSEVPLSRAFLYEKAIYIKIEPFQKNNPNLLCIKGEYKDIKYPYVTQFGDENIEVELLEDVIVTF